MVTGFTETKDRVEYSLNRVQELAAQQSVAYVGNTERDVANLDYKLMDVCACLQSLTSAQFRHSERYSETGSWRDVYHISYKGPCHGVDDLYIKLRLDRDCIYVYLDSFHLQRL